MAKVEYIKGLGNVRRFDDGLATMPRVIKQQYEMNQIFESTVRIGPYGEILSESPSLMSGPMMSSSGSDMLLNSQIIEQQTENLFNENT